MNLQAMKRYLKNLLLLVKDVFVINNRTEDGDKAPSSVLFFSYYLFFIFKEYIFKYF